MNTLSEMRLMRLIYNLHTGAPVKPDAMWKVMIQLRNRIIRMLENGSITDNEERQKIEFLLKTKKWNPYCIRHSAITSDSDFLPEYALKKEVRWTLYPTKVNNQMKLFNQTDNLTGQRLICPILRSYIENKETEVIK
jgi:hypothetical protein